MVICFSPLCSSYWTWGILFTLVILTQILGLGEKFWIKVCLAPFLIHPIVTDTSVKIWGGAYGEGSTVPMEHFSYSYRAYAESQHVLDDGLAHFRGTTAVHAPTLPFMTMTIKFLPAPEHPYFYIGIQAAIRSCQHPSRSRSLFHCLRHIRCWSSSPDCFRRSLAK